MTNIELPNLSGLREISQSEIESFQEDGHTIIRGLASPTEVAAYRNVIADAAARYNVQTKPLSERDTYGKAFLQIMNLWRHDDAVRLFTLARRFAGVAARLMGVSGVRLYHDQALFKEPGGGRTPWHQDQYYWPLDTANTITMWMPLVDVPAEVGSMTFASGSHKHGFIESVPISDKSDEYFSNYVHNAKIPLVCHGGMTAGDATFHYGWTLHAAPANPTPNMREVMTVIYFADGSRVIKPDNPNRAGDLRCWLPGIQPGNLAASELNPLLFT